MTDASAGEKRTCRSQFPGSNASRLTERALLSRLQPLLQAHARGRDQIGRGIRRAILRQQRVKLLLRLQFGCAIGAAGHMLLQFMAGVIGQFAINLKHDIFSNPFTFHRCTFIGH